ncbi:peptidoglycan-recognition protein LC-like isoform X2 [Chrysoperla carnea]|uniref:peptidoglycan-recognition protein LC-like isoform X2 n=1 Tax=Chrysoperla carnea TaxID=189513 RepID=UPI001D08473A|nr:peptidoglycan-recognition protein LC-like isoform X2 [Chrysoperla carnea]
MVTFMGDSNENENNSTSSIKLQNFQNNNTTIAKSLDTLSVQSDDSISSTDSENLTADGVLISPSRLAVPENGLNIVNSSHVRVGDEVHNNYLGPITVNKQLTIRDLEVNSDQRPHKYAINGNIESDNCDNSLGNINPSFTPENNCDTQIKTAKLDDGLFIITNKNIENCNINTQTGKLRSILLLASPFTLILLIFLLIGGVFLYKNITNRTFVRWRPDTNEQDKNIPIDGSNISIAGPTKLRIIPRQEWIAQPPSQPANVLDLPVPFVIIMHTATESCTTRAQCKYQCRQIQTFHLESNGWWDIGYNFLVGGDGLAYEGRGWYAEGAHTYSYNAKSIGIAFIGTFNTLKPPQIQIEAAKKLIKKAEEMHILTPNYQIIGARDVDATLSPGQEVYDIIQTWPHYSNNITKV